MSATTRRLRIPSSGPFVQPDDAQGNPPEAGEGTPGLVFRYKGASAQQTYPNAGPTQQLINWRNYLDTADDNAPAWPVPQMGPFYVDVELYLRFVQLGTTNIDLDLLLHHQFASPVGRTWNQVNIGPTEPLSLLFTERFIYEPANATLVWDGFAADMNAIADAGDVILDNPNCYAKFQFFQGPVQP